MEFFGKYLTWPEEEKKVPRKAVKKKSQTSYNWSTTSVGVVPHINAVSEGQQTNKVWGQPKKKKMRKEVKKYTVEKLISKFQAGNNETFFKVKWDGYNDITIEPRSNLMKDIPLMIKSFEDGLASASRSSTLNTLCKAAETL